jgi:hypothetical protein
MSNLIIHRQRMSRICMCAASQMTALGYQSQINMVRARHLLCLYSYSSSFSCYLPSSPVFLKMDFLSMG